MFLSDKDIKIALRDGVLRVTPLDDSQIGPTSIDLHLGTILLRYDSQPIRLGDSVSSITEIEIDSEQGYILQPQGFVLGHTFEEVSIPPHLQGWIETKGDIARSGLQIHNTDGHVDPGFRGTVTLEISNNNTVPIILYPHILICQIYFALLSSECEKPYSGKYVGQKKPTPYIPRPRNAIS